MGLASAVVTLHRGIWKVYNVAQDITKLSGIKVQKTPGDAPFPVPQPPRRGGLLRPLDPLNDVFPIQSVHIDWDRLIAKRPLILQTVEQMPVYLLKPEVLGLLDAAKHPTYRLILDLMWTTGARISEVLALTPSSFIEDGYGYGVVLTTLKQRPGRPKKTALARSVKRYVPIADLLLQDRIQSYLYAGRFRKTERIFPIVRQTVNRHINSLVERVGGGIFGSAVTRFGTPLRCTSY